MKSAGRGGQTGTNSALDRGRALYQQRAWDDAYQALAEADRAAPLGTDDLELLGWSASLSGHGETQLKVLERLHHLHLDQGDVPRAARVAFWLSFRLMAVGEAGQSAGWLGRAQRLMEQHPQPCVEHGYLLLPLVQRLFAAGDLLGAHATATRAGEIAETFRDRDLAALARQLQGRALLRQGQVATGMALLDEVMVAAAAGELSPVVTGVIYCAVIASCHQVYALGRAREWTAALSDWCQAQPQLVTFTSICLVHRAELMQLSGSWPEAIAEAQRAGERCAQGTDPPAAANACYQRAEIHRLRGEFAAAEAAYQETRVLGTEPQPGLALLRLAQGDREAAASAIRRVVAATPTTDALGRARLLPAHVEVMLAVGDRDEATRACHELAQIATALQSEVLQAIAAQARGAVLLDSGDASAAVPDLRQAFDLWQRLGAPYLAARLHMLLARACRALGDGESAGLEVDAARAVFVRLGAQPDLTAADLLAPAASSARKGARGLTERELQVLRLVAAGKTNKEVAQQLSLSEKTVDRHVSNIFTKIDVSTRAAATAFAYQNQLV